MDYREHNRRLLVYWSPKDASGQALCHLCRKDPGSQMHEIINRYQTSGEARKLSFTYTLCSWLCPTCHMFLAPMRHSEAQLWEFNFNLYGKERVMDDINRVQSALRHHLILSLPE